MGLYILFFWSVMTCSKEIDLVMLIHHEQSRRSEHFINCFIMYLELTVQCTVYTYTLYCNHQLLCSSCVQLYSAAVVQLYDAAVVYSCTIQLLCTVVECSCRVFYKLSLYFLFNCTMPRSIHKHIAPYNSKNQK